jgi:hypothetical protein
MLRLATHLRRSQGAARGCFEAASAASAVAATAAPWLPARPASHFESPLCARPQIHPFFPAQHVIRGFSTSPSGGSSRPEAAKLSGAAPHSTRPSWPRRIGRVALRAAVWTGKASWTAAGAGFRIARRRPLHALLFLSVLGLGVSVALWRRERLAREKEVLQQQQAAMLSGAPLPPVPEAAIQKASRTVAAFVWPPWAEKGGAELRELASLLNGMPQMAQQIREGGHDQPLHCEDSLGSFSSENALTPRMTPAQAMERLRLLLQDGQLLHSVEVEGLDSYICLRSVGVCAM